MKNRMPRKLKKKYKKAVAFLKTHRAVLNKAFQDEFLWGFSGIHVNKKTSEMKNVAYNEMLNLMDKEQWNQKPTP